MNRGPIIYIDAAGLDADFTAAIRDGTFAIYLKKLYLYHDQAVSLRDSITTLLGEKGATVERLLNVARGCHDYGGGYRGEQAQSAAFHHGIQTVIQALEAVAENRLNDLTATLESIGKATQKEKTGN